MGRSLNKVFLGMLIIFLDINLVPINVLPNFLGYLIILSALKELTVGYRNDIVEGIYPCAKVKEAFKFGILPAKIMVGITFIMFVISPFKAEFSGNVVFLATMVKSLSLLGEICVIYSILRGIHLEATLRGWKDKADMAFNRWHVYLVTTVIVMIYSAYFINFYYDSDFNDVLTFSVYGISVLVKIFLLTLTKGTSNAIKYSGNYI
ncbi:MAG: hypothetical protein RSB66_03655 [Clostridium sp.]